MNGLNEKWNTEKSTTEEINRNFKNMWIRGQELWNCPVRGEQRKKNGSVSDVLNNLKRKQPSKYWRLKRRREEEGGGTLIQRNKGWELLKYMERSAYPSSRRSRVTKKCKLEIFSRHTIIKCG